LNVVTTIVYQQTDATASAQPIRGTDTIRRSSSRRSRSSKEEEDKEEEEEEEEEEEKEKNKKKKNKKRPDVTWGWQKQVQGWVAVPGQQHLHGPAPGHASGGAAP